MSNTYIYFRLYKYWTHINQIINIFEKKNIFFEFLNICRIDKYNTRLQYVKTLTTNMDTNEEKNVKIIL